MTGAPKPGKGNARARAASGGGLRMGEVYRVCRMLHAYLSAFAFLALLFFAFTGLTLNHPTWLAQRPGEQVRHVAIPKAEVDAAMRTSDPGRALGAAVARLTPLKGRYASGEVLDGEALLRFEGPAGSSDAAVQVATGETEVGVRPAGLVATLNDLHKGKAAGGAWRWVIDISAVVVILLSLIGYVLFFSLRFRLRTSLILTGLSLAALLGLYFAFVA
jgi:hypothetical protein